MEHDVFAHLLAAAREDLIHLHKITKKKVINSTAVKILIFAEQFNRSVNKPNLGVLKLKEKQNVMMQEQGWWLCSLYSDAYRMWLKVKMQEDDLCWKEIWEMKSVAQEHGEIVFLCVHKKEIQNKRK